GISLRRGTSRGGPRGVVPVVAGAWGHTKNGNWGPANSHRRGDCMSNATRKVALVTGSATGIGRAAALRFAREGLAVAVNYSRSEADAQETLAAVQRFGVPAILCRAPVQDEPAVRAMVARCREGVGALDVVV